MTLTAAPEVMSLDAAPSASQGPWRLATFALAAVLAAAIGSAVWRVPIQVSDSLAEILDAQRSPSVASAFRSSLTSTAYLRPLRIAQIKALFDLSGGRFRLAYRGFHVLLVIGLLLVFTSVLPVRTAADFAAAAFALTVLVGLHTFQGFVREAFPINHFLLVAVLCVAALRLTQSRGGWAVDAGAALLFVWGALTLESGLLVWVVVAAAWTCGLRGVSGRGVLLVSALLVGYLALRFVYLDTGVPALTERSSGFLLERLEPDAIQQRFGEAPLVFYAYNMTAALSSVLFSEPREGVFVAGAEVLEGTILPRTWVAIGASLAATALIATALSTRVRRGVALDSADRIALVSVAVVAANSLLSFAYLKDDVIAVAGVFYAAAAFTGARVALGWVDRRRTARAVMVMSAGFLALAGLWAIRTLAVDHALRAQAFRVRNDWASVVLQLTREGRLPDDPRAGALVRQLRDEALDAPAPNPQLLPAWHNEWFGD